MPKGSQFEREFCVQLSEWWTDGERSDIFWRTSGSGARATTRKKKDKHTAGQFGDIGATDPIGAPLIELITIECKRGYSKYTIADLLDKPKKKAAIQQYEKWITKAINCHKAAGSKSWMLVTRRDRREALVFMPYELFFNLFDDAEDLEAQKAVFHLYVGGAQLSLCCISLAEWFEAIKPMTITTRHREWKNART